MRFRTSLACLCLALGLIASLIAPALLADGTLLGTINGRVLDQDGKALPGATIELTSAEKGFQRTAVSDASGAFNFPLLQPGPYFVSISLAGFQSYEAKNVIVSADKRTDVSASLKLAAAAEAVTVTGEAPLVDKSNTSATTNVNSELTQKLAVGRGYQNLITFAPGVTSANNSANANSHGALSSNNLYLFDGVDTTDPTTGTFGQNFNYEAIQEVNVSTSGISAEYGRSQGAIVNVITKSGTNQLHGSFKALLTNDNWTSQNKGSAPITGNSFARVKYDKLIPDYAATLGGPIWQDHLWFFGSYEWVDATTPQRQTASSPIPGNENFTGQNYQQTTNTRLWDGKLTAQITSSQLFTAQFNSDPITGFVIDYWGTGSPAADLGALTAQGQNECGGFGCTKQFRWSGVFGSRVSMEAGWATANGNIFVGPAFGHGSPFLNLADGFFYNGATFDGFVVRPRTQANLAGSVYHELFGKAAQFKAGVDYQLVRSENSFTYPNNEIFVVANFNPALGQNQNFEVGDEWDRLTTPVPSVSRGKIWGFYGLEKFEAGPVSMNLGVRVEKQSETSDLGNVVVDATTVDPRLSAAWDIMGDGKTLVSGGWGRYHQFLIQDISDSVFSGVPVQTNRDIFLWNGSDFEFAQSITVGGNNQPVNTGLKPSYVDEFNIALQRQIGNTMAVGVRGIYRKWYNLVDDVKSLTDDGVLLKVPQNFDDSISKRSYKAIELTVEKRFSGNWQALANYTLSRAFGNVFADYASTLYDFPGDTCSPVGIGPMPCVDAEGANHYGIAGFDRTSIFNAFVAYTASLPVVNITAAPSFNVQSGLPYQRQRSFAAPDNSRPIYFYDQRGDERLPTTYQLNFALEGTFKPFGNGALSLVGGPVEIGLKAEVFNLTNQQKVYRTDLISLAPSQGEVGGTTGNIFGAPTSRNALQPPRNYRFTALLRF